MENKSILYHDECKKVEEFIFAHLAGWLDSVPADEVIYSYTRKNNDFDITFGTRYNEKSRMEVRLNNDMIVVSVSTPGEKSVSYIFIETRFDAVKNIKKRPIDSGFKMTNLDDIEVGPWYHEMQRMILNGILKPNAFKPTYSVPEVIPETIQKTQERVNKTHTVLFIDKFVNPDGLGQKFYNDVQVRWTNEELYAHQLGIDDEELTPQEIREAELFKNGTATE